MVYSDILFAGFMQVCKWDKPHDRGKHSKKPRMWQQWSECIWEPFFPSVECATTKTSWPWWFLWFSYWYVRSKMREGWSNIPQELDHLMLYINWRLVQRVQRNHSFFFSFCKCFNIATESNKLGDANEAWTLRIECSMYHSMYVNGDSCSKEVSPAE
jgi:hypothetical protein